MDAMFTTIMKCDCPDDLHMDDCPAMKQIEQNLGKAKLELEEMGIGLTWQPMRAAPMPISREELEYLAKRGMELDLAVPKFFVEAKPRAKYPASKAEVWATGRQGYSGFPGSLVTSVESAQNLFAMREHFTKMAAALAMIWDPSLVLKKDVQRAPAPAAPREPRE